MGEAGLIDLGAHDVQNILAQTDTAQISGWWSQSRLRYICDHVVDLIAPVAHVAQNGIRLFNQIHLEANVINNLVGLPWDRNNGYKVDERHSTASIVDQRCLTLFAGVEHPLEVGDGDIICVFSFRALDDFAIWTLEKSTVAADNL